MSRVALCEIRGLLEPLATALAGEEGDTWRVALAKFIRKQNPWSDGTDGLWQTPEQAAGGSCTLEEMLDAAPKGETRTIDWYLEDPENRVPKEWEGKFIFFRNSEFRDGGGHRCLRYLLRDGGRWGRCYYWLNRRMDGRVFLAVPASALKKSD